MKNHQVVARWLEDKPGKSDNGNLRSNGLDLYSYDALIGGTRASDGAKLVLVAWSVSPTTTEHVNTALYSRNPEHSITAVSAVAGDGLTPATVKVFPHDVLTALKGHEHDPASVPVPEPQRDKATDYHAGALVEWREDTGKPVRSRITGVRRYPNSNIQVQINTPLPTGGEVGQYVTVTPDGSILGSDNGARLVVVKPHYTRVVFRVWNNEDGSYGDEGNDVIALFPELTGDYDAATCESFMHIGQHGSADYLHVMRSTRRAYKGEYLPLLRELENDYGYRLKVMQKPNLYHYRRIREAQLRAALP